MRKFNKKYLFASVLVFTMFITLGSILVYAQGSGDNQGAGSGENQGSGSGENEGVGSGKNQDIPIKIENPFRGGDTLQELLATIINEIVFPVGGILAVLAFVWSGFMYVTARGDETKLKTAHRALLYTAVGTAVLLGALVISQVIEGTIEQLKSP